MFSAGAGRFQFHQLQMLGTSSYGIYFGGCFVEACVCNFFSVCVSVESGVINDNELYFLGTARLMEEIGQRGYRVDGHSSFISFVSLRVSSPLWARLLSYRETSLDADSYRCEQKHIFFPFDCLLWLAQMASE